MGKPFDVTSQMKPFWQMFWMVLLRFKIFTEWHLEFFLNFTWPLWGVKRLKTPLGICTSQDRNKFYYIWIGTPVVCASNGKTFGCKRKVEPRVEVIGMNGWKCFVLQYIHLKPTCSRTLTPTKEKRFSFGERVRIHVSGIRESPGKKLDIDLGKSWKSINSSIK